MQDSDHLTSPVPSEDLPPALREDSGYFLAAGHINNLQHRSIDRFLRMARGMSRADIVMRIGGRDERFEADWLRHMEVIDGTTAEARAGHALEEYECVKRCLDHYGAPTHGGIAGRELSLWGRICAFAGKQDQQVAQSNLDAQCEPSR